MSLELKLQLHYNFLDNDSHLLDFYTRKTCSESQIRIIEIILGMLYPGVKFQIFSLPAEPGSFKDFSVIRFLNENHGTTSTMLSAITMLFGAVLMNGQIKNDQTSYQLNSLSIIEQCRSLGLDDIQLTLIEQEICESYGIKREKNNFYESLKSDNSINSINSKIENQNGEVLFDELVQREEFENYIEDLPQQKEFIREGQFGNIELAQPFILKQQQYGRGVAWKGIYYGEDVIDTETKEVILSDGESVYFYMQDDEYKGQVLNQDISFTSGDNIGVIFDIGRFYDYVNKKYGKPRVYVKRVTSHNDNLIQHKKDLILKNKIKKFEEQNKDQSSLFDSLNKN